MLSAVKHRPFGLLWAGQTASRLGDSLYRIALAWWVLEKTGSASAMGTVLVFSFTPMIIFLLVGGITADRLPRLKVMLASDLLRGILVSLVAVLAFSGRLEIWHIYLLSLVFGFADAFFQPAYAAVLPQITPQVLLPGANALTTLSGQLAGIAGPAIGAFIVKLGGTSLAFALNGASFFIAGACILPLFSSLQANPPQAGTGEKPGILVDIREGWNAVVATPWLGISILLAAFANMVMSGPLNIALPFFVRETLHKDVDSFGWLLSMSSFGSVTAALIMSRFHKYRRRGFFIYLPWISASLMVAAVGMLTSVPPAVCVLFLFGFFISIGSLVWVNALQEMVPTHLLGRVSSLDALGSFALLPIGYALTGWLTDVFSAPIVLTAGGLLGAAATALGLLHPSVRNLD